MPETQLQLKQRLIALTYEMEAIAKRGQDIQKEMVAIVGKLRLNDRIEPRTKRRRRPRPKAQSSKGRK